VLQQGLGPAVEATAVPSPSPPPNANAGAHQPQQLQQQPGGSSQQFALPAASQQFPVLAQPAASAAATAAAAAPALYSLQPADSDTSSGGAVAGGSKKAAQLLQPDHHQQQRRRAGPVNQWRPGMPLVGAPLASGVATPFALAVVQQQQQLQQAVNMQLAQMRGAQQPGGQQGPPTAVFNPLSAQLLLSLAQGSQLASTQQQLPAAGGQASAVPAAAPGTGPPGATNTAAAAGSEPAAAQPASSSTAATGAAAAFGGVGADVGDCKLLSCAVEQQGNQLALELLLAGQLYRGCLARVALAAGAAPPAGAAAAASGGVEAQPQLATDAGLAAVLEVAQQRQGMCILCALPFAAQQQQQPPSGDADSAPPPPLCSEQEQQLQLASAGLHAQQQAMLQALGQPLTLSLAAADGSCIALHEACAGQHAASAQQQQQHVAHCLSRHCCGCRQRGASLWCGAPGCSKAFHVPCLEAMGAVVTQVRPWHESGPWVCSDG
jgi:hypothetical protein